MSQDYTPPFQQPSPSPQQPQAMPMPSWSQVTKGFLNEQSLGLLFFAVCAALFIAYLLADREERNRAHTSRPPKVPPEPQQSKPQS